MNTKTVSVLEGNTFVVSDFRGDIEASLSDPVGLFSWDTRFLSKWVLTIDGVKPNVLSTDDLDYFAVQFFLVPGTGTIYVDADLSIIRKRAVGQGFEEEITILNHKNSPVDLTVKIAAGCDFADLFEVKDAQTKKGKYYDRVEKNQLIYGYRRESFFRETTISSSVPAKIDKEGLTFSVHIEPHNAWTTTLEIIPSEILTSLKEKTVHHARNIDNAKLRMKEDLQKIGEDVPKISCDWEPLIEIYRRSLMDLAALRFFPAALPGQYLPAAGLPWFMTIFGRDSMITSLQALPFTPQLAKTTLQILSERQGTRVDDFRDEEPGKIMHEMRFGELTAFEERPQSPYFGAADVTPFFIILLDEYERWTGDAEMIRNLELEARACLDWINTYGDSNGDGYVDYKRHKETGLENQCWKDSWNSILFADGSNSKLPRATCEIQGYVYDAKIRAARLAREFWNDVALAYKLEQEAKDLKERFNKDYWIEDRGFFALAIDGDGKKVDSLTSNIGHLLWSGIIDDKKVDTVVHQLMSDKLYSGWGIRTMAEGEGGYNPIGYHVGTVWPHDNSIIALGLRKYGYVDLAAEVAMHMFEAAKYFGGRLPEAFAGYERAVTDFPVEYPTACSPQAWATGAPLLLLRAILGLEPINEQLVVDAALPKTLGQLELLDIPGRWGKVDAFGRGRIETEKENKAINHLKSTMIT